MPQKIGLVGLWALNVALYAVLLAVGVESVLDLSPVWPVILGTVVIYAVLVGLLWRATDVTLKWEMSAAALAGLLAYSGWRTGSLAAPGGVKVFGQSADVAAAALLVLILASIAITVACVRQLPWWLRAIVACIVLYAVVPLIASLIHGAGLLAALQTNAPFPTEPFWIRGAFIGASIILPIAGAAALVAAGVLAARRSGGAALRLAAGGLTLVLAAQMSGLETVNAGLPALPAFEPRTAVPSWAPSYSQSQTQTQATAQPGTTPTGSTQMQTGQTGAMQVALAMPAAGDYQSAASQTLSTPPATAADPEQLATKLDKVVQAMQPATYEIDERAATLGSDVNTIFSFVRDQIRFESYPGILKGPSATYAARAGNAFDRSLLLAHVLTAKNIPVRFATCQLAQSDAAKLYDRIFEPQTTLTATPSTAAGLSDATSLKERVYARARRDFAVIQTALNGQPPDVISPSRDDVIKEIQSHMWVQAQAGGHWTDLDTSFADAVPGKAYCAPDKTINAPTDDMMQQVTMRVVTETLANGALTHDTSLEVKVPVYQLLDQQVFFLYTPPGLKGLLGSSDKLAPMIDIAGDQHVGKPIDFSETQAQSQGKLGGVISAFGTAAPMATTFVADWLEFQLRFPGGRTELTRRVLTDRAGPAWRASTTHDPSALRPLKRDAQGVPLEAQAIYNVWFSAGGHDTYAYAEAAAQLLHGLRSAGNTSPAPQLSFEQQAWPLALGDFGWVLWSDRFAVASLNDSAGLRFYADSPRLLMFGFGLNPQGSGGYFSQTDLRRDTLRGLSRDASGMGSVIKHKLWFGAVEGALEHETTASELSGSGAQAVLTSTSSLVSSDGAVVVRPGSNVQTITSDADTAARMSTALSNGDVLIVPRAGSQGGLAGWWDIAHNGGDTRAVLGPDLNMAKGVWNPGNYGRVTGPRGGSNIPRTYQVDPNTYNSRPLPRPGEGNFGAPRGGACGSEESCLNVWIVVAAAIEFVVVGYAVIQAISLVLQAFELP